MGIRENLQKIIDRKTQEIDELEQNIRDARQYLQGIQDAMKALPKGAGVSEQRTLRPGTEIAKVQELLQRAKKPLHISDLLRQLGKTLDAKNRVSLSGSLSAYVREGQIFTRTAPNTFGLTEFSYEHEQGKDEHSIPVTFGKVS